MTRSLTFTLILAAALVLALLWIKQNGNQELAWAPTDPVVDPAALETVPDHVVFDVVIDTPSDFAALLDRAEAVSRQPGPGDVPPRVTLVLHGPEVVYFDRNRYDEHKALVDQAARLDALGIIDFKMCETRMRALGMTPSDVPPFIETVPFGPTEVERQRGQGALIL